MIALFSKAKSTPPLRGKLAVLIPTYRFDARARHTIAATASLASEDIAVVIADNSEKPEKWEYLRKLKELHSNVHVFCHKQNIGAGSNWRFLLEQASLEFYLFVGDDDFCTPQYVETALRLLQSDEEASAAAGGFLMVTADNRMLGANRGRTEKAAYDRCAGFLIGGGNSLPNSMGRRSAVQPFLEYNDHHPLKASFFDWIMAYTLLAKGTYRTEDRGYYLYDVSNWQTPESAWSSNARFYAAAGLPEAFTWFHELYWAVEFAHFFRGAYSPVEDRNETLRCAQFFYRDRIQVFRQYWEHPSLGDELRKAVSHRAQAMEGLNALSSNDDALHPRLFDWFNAVLATFDATCALAYSDYVNGSLHRAQMAAKSAG